MSDLAEPIERMNREAQAAIDALGDPGVASVRTAADDIFRRALVLAIGSYCEKRIVTAIERFCEKSSSANVELCTFVKKKALTRQYHTLFSWDQANANTFLQLFGARFQASFLASMKGDAAIEDGVRCFLQLGVLRNKLAHEGLDFQLQLTRDDVMRDFRVALQFVEAIERALGI